MKRQVVKASEQVVIEYSEELVRFMGLNLAKDFWWMKPFYGTSFEQLPSRVQFLIGEYENELGESRYLVVIPSVHQNQKGEVIEIGNALMIRSSLPDTDCDAVIGVVVSDCLEIEDGIREAVTILASEIEGFNLRETKSVPTYYDYLGWCTWDVFYREVSEAGVMEALDVFKERGVKPYYMILDDGWQDVKDELYLNDIYENEKFPSGLKTLVQKAKEEYGISVFGIWHALQGYWGGINPEGRLGKKYTLIENKDVKESEFATYFTDHTHYISAEDAESFYDEFYTYLKECGIDYVKVDSQGNLLHLCEQADNPTAVMTMYQQALKKAGNKYLNGNVLYCMSNSTEVIYNTSEFIGWRNSDDFFPKEPIGIQLEHYYMNTLNNIFTSTFVCPDWDMFQTNHPQGEFHAMVRAISGGPIYICDHPKNMDTNLLSRLMIRGNELLRFNQPARPTSDCYLSDAKTSTILLKTHNYGEFGSTIFAVHLNKDAGIIKEVVTGDICFTPDLGEVALGKLEIVLNYGEYAYVSRAVRREMVTPLGLVHKFNSYLAIESVVESENEMMLKVKGEGAFAFYVEESCLITLLTVNGETRVFEIDNHLLQVELSEATSVIKLNWK
ncbi:Sip1-related alpha-galactosidase [Turicibacter sanguinis]|uniref:Sip1-related alpha-galactosidase n=1 Tax=Turicibacter sanguinis TaxID=154288 RepID=UPI0018AA9D4B|nr:Sip1-related alpha-galactosidase [Turicibacter sanguinis]MDB8567026.1 Sip1-related alpha-galactosidase [Turicibacter sanguinis]MDB8569776.1 Sip1-related alpha-galactosidase [Turicibacter sanguinis]MDB8572527.1 Sip1-related alpha-galactosidase [Turicibacter sanguinis]MDB8581168.1 Sip1-related alpha-galactosidase [Turicibacter sanguinis]